MIPALLSNALFVTVFGTSALVPFEPAATLSGVARVVDGDGLLFGKVEVRLRGIAAPELSDPMGAESRANLVKLASGKLADCYLDGSTAGRSRRPVGICIVDGLDVGALQVAGGYALDCPKYSDGQYDKAQVSAITEGNDLSQVYELPSYC